MDKAFARAMTHLRHARIFLVNWIAHYGTIDGREDLFVVIDGDDRKTQVNLSSTQTEVLHNAPRKRAANDGFMARKTPSRTKYVLRERYRYVMRIDVDDDVVVGSAIALPVDAVNDIALAEFPIAEQDRPAARPNPRRHPAAPERGFPMMVPTISPLCSEPQKDDSPWASASTSRFNWPISPPW